MKAVKYLIGLMMLTSIVACDDLLEDTNYYEELENLYNTTWYRNITTDKVYFYDIAFSDSAVADKEGWYDGNMICYDSEKRENRIDELCQKFTYNYTPATNGNRAIVKTAFEDGKYYDGFLIPKGHLKINNLDVFVIQLYSVDAEGNPIMDDKGEYESAIMMWKE